MGTVAGEAMKTSVGVARLPAQFAVNERDVWGGERPIRYGCNGQPSVSVAG